MLNYSTGWEDDDWTPITAPRIRRQATAKYHKPDVQKIVPPPEGIDPWEAPDIIVSDAKLPAFVDSKNWVPPEFDAKGHQLCTRYYPCQSPDCIKCDDRKSHRKAKKLAAKIEAAQNRGNAVAFVTLTIRHRDQKVKAQRIATLEAFRALRASKWWKAAVLGGHATYHFAGSHAEEDGYNTHLHMVTELAAGVDGVDVDELREVWVRVGGGIMVEAKTIPPQYRDRQRVAHYLTAGLLRQFIDRDMAELRRVRAATYRAAKSLPFGTWRGGRRTAKAVGREVEPDTGAVGADGVDAVGGPPSASLQAGWQSATPSGPSTAPTATPRAIDGWDGEDQGEVIGAVLVADRDVVMGVEGSEPVLDYRYHKRRVMTPTAPVAPVAADYPDSHHWPDCFTQEPQEEEQLPDVCDTYNLGVRETSQGEPDQLETIEEEVHPSHHWMKHIIRGTT